MRAHDVKIGHRLALAFCLILFLMAGVTAISVLSSRDARHGLSASVHGAAARTAVLATMRQALFRQLLLGRSVAVSNDVVQMPTDMAAILHEANNYRQSAAQLDALALSDAERAILERTRQYERDVAPFVQEAKDAVDGFNGSIATRALTAKAGPVQEQWLLALDELGALQANKVAADMDGIAGGLDRANTLMMAICGGAMLLAVAIGCLLHRAITAPLKDAVGLARRVAAAPSPARLPGAKARPRLAS